MLSLPSSFPFLCCCIPLHALAFGGRCSLRSQSLPCFSNVRNTCNYNSTDRGKNWQMSIIKQSIVPTGQPAFPFTGSASHDHDASQKIQGVLPSHGTQSLKPFQQPSSYKTSSLAIASGIGEPFCEVPTVSMKSQRQNGMVEGICNLSQLLGDEDETAMKTVSDKQSKMFLHDMEFQPFSPSFFSSLLEKKNFQQGKWKDQLDHFSFEQSCALSVSVSSAVKLKVEQIDLIARKMQKLTGFRHLRLENVIDPSLIAGFVISYGNDSSSVIDLSVKGQLAALAARVEFSDRSRHVQNWTCPETKS